MGKIKPIFPCLWSRAFRFAAPHGLAERVSVLLTHALSRPRILRGFRAKFFGDSRVLDVVFFHLGFGPFADTEDPVVPEIKPVEQFHIRWEWEHSVKWDSV